MTAAEASTTTKQRDKVLAAALEVFAREGFEGAKVRDIAAVAGCNHATIRYHYATKDNLWREAVAFLFERMDRELAITPELSKALIRGERDAFETWLRMYVHYCAKHPDHARIMVQTSVREDDRLNWAADSFIKLQHQRLIPVFKALIANGVLPDHNPVHLIYMIAATCQMLFTLAPEAQRVHKVRINNAEIDRYADAAIAMILGPAS